MTLRLSPKTFAKAIGVSESSLKRWADQGRIAVMRTPGGHRKIEQSEAIRFIRDEGLTIVDPRPIGLADAASLALLTEKSSSQSEALIHAITAGDTTAAQSLLLAMYVDGQSIASLCDGPLRLAMEQIGQRWKHDADGIHLEHRATATCMESLLHLRSILPAPAVDAPLAIGCAAEHDPYILPSLMVATVLQSEGWRTINLGPTLPVSSLVRAVAYHQPRLVWLSVSVKQAMENLSPDLHALAQQLASENRMLLAGGREWSTPRGRMPALFVANDMTEMVAFAKGLYHRPTTG